jgi:hypothetical protein
VTIQRAHRLHQSPLLPQVKQNLKVGLSSRTCQAHLVILDVFCSNPVLLLEERQRS